MKKIFTFLMMLCMFVGTATAEQLVTNGVYTLGVDENSKRGFLGYGQANGTTFENVPVLCDITWTDWQRNSSTPLTNGKNWYIVSTDGGSTYYIYNIGKGQFIKRGQGNNVDFSDEPYPWIIQTRGNYKNIGDSKTNDSWISGGCGRAPGGADPQVKMDGNEGDGGSLYTITEVENGNTAFATEIAAANQKIEELVTNVERERLKEEIREVLAAFTVENGKVSAPGEVPTFGQYDYEYYQNLDFFYNNSESISLLKQALDNFKNSKNFPVYIIKSAWDEGYPNGSAIYYDGAWKWKKANYYDKQMWMTIVDHNEIDIPAVEQYSAEGTSYKICDVATGTLMRDKEVQIVKINGWEGVYNLQYNADGSNTDAAQHAKDNGQIVNWKVATTSNCQASAWRIEYIGTFYELSKMTDEYLNAGKELHTLYYNINSLDYSWGESVNQYTEDTPGTLETAKATALASLNKKFDTQENILAAKTALETAKAGMKLNMPVDGKFYRLRCTGSGMKYLQYTQNTNPERFDMISGDAGKTVNATFCYTNEALVAYAKPMYINHDSNVASYKMNKTKVTFSEARNVVGQYFINVGGRYLYGDGNNSDSGSSTNNNAGYRWWLEEVTEIPVTISAAKFASFYAPCNLVVPTGVTAYYINSKTETANGETWAHLEEIGNVIPAGTGVILYADVEEATTFNLTVSGEATAIEDNWLKGTVASAYIDVESYVLSNKNGIGLYIAEMQDDTWLNNGFKAYLPVSATGTTSNVLRFTFGGNTTAIESVLNNDADANAPIYDLSGRRVMNTVKGGIYIQNGKKFVVK